MSRCRSKLHVIFKLVQKSYKVIDKKTQFSLSHLYFSHDRVDKNYEKLYEWFLEDAKQSHAKDQFTVDVMRSKVFNEIFNN